MQAFVKYGNASGQAGLADIPRPAPGPGQVLVEVAGCGVCGSDLHAFNADPGYEWMEPPVTLGHEFAGVMVEAGQGVDSARVGDHVTALAIQACLACLDCLSGNSHLCSERRVIGLHMDGGMARFVVVDAAQLIRLPQGLNLNLGTLVEPVSVALHALNRVVIRPGQKVVVSGPGPIGLLCASLAALSGAGVLLLGMNRDNEARLPAARRLGLETALVEDELPVEVVKSHFGGELADLFVEASGSSAALASGIQTVRRGGQILSVALYSQEMTWFPTPAVRDELSILFSYASTHRDYNQAIGLIIDQVLDFSALVEYFPMDRAEEVFREVQGGKFVKPVLVF